ncbi:MAG: hypothetical protein ACRBN8_19315 [Nannocystales bacterium]
MTDDSDGLPDLPEVPPTQQMQELFDAYRDQTHRSAAEVESALQSVATQVGTAGLSATAAGLSTTAKLGWAAAVLGVVGVIGLAVASPDPQPDRQPDPHNEPAAPTTPVTSGPTPPPLVDKAEPPYPRTSAPPEPPPEEDTAALDSPSPTRHKPKPKPKAAAKPMPTKPAPADTLAEELLKLQRIRAALRTGAPARARSLIEAHRRDHPNSSLARERDATEIAALCAEKRDADAKRKAAAFAKAYPGSSQNLLSDCDG